MTKRSRKIVTFHRNAIAEYYRGEIEDHVMDIKKMLRPLTELATYNAEMEDAEIRADRADEMRRRIEYKLADIAQDMEEITRLIKRGKQNMQNWIKREDECQAHFTMTEEEYRGLMAEAQAVDDMDAPEDPELTEEQEAMYREMEEEVLARMRDIDSTYDSPIDDI